MPTWALRATRPPRHDLHLRSRPGGAPSGERHLVAVPAVLLLLPRSQPEASRMRTAMFAIRVLLSVVALIGIVVFALLAMVALPLSLLALFALLSLLAFGGV